MIVRLVFEEGRPGPRVARAQVNGVAALVGHYEISQYPDLLAAGNGLTIVEVDLATEETTSHADEVIHA